MMSRHRETAASGACRVTLIVALFAASLTLAPTSARASTLPSDRIGAVSLSSGQVPSTSAPDISARGGTLVGLGGTQLWGRSASTKRRMASTTKVMTAVLALERCDLDERVRITKAAAATPYALGLKTGETRTVRELLELALVASSNDAASALAIHMGGTIPGFATIMNQRAGQLGLSGTHYVNPHGLDVKGHYTTPADLSRLMRHAVSFAEFKRIIKKRSVTLPAYKTRAARTYKSTDKLLGLVDGLRGGKTGFTNDAGYCFVASARRDGITLTSVVLGSPSSTARFSSSRRLLEWGFKHYKVRTLCAGSTVAGHTPLADNPQLSLQTMCSRVATAAVFDLAGTVVKSTSLPTSVTVPVFAGQRIGTVTYRQGAKVLATVAAVASAPIASAEETVGVVAVTGSSEATVAVRAAASQALVAPFDTTRPVQRVLTLANYAAAPVAKGQMLGKITYKQDGAVLVVVLVVATRDVEAMTPLESLGAALDGLADTATGFVTQP